MIFFKESRYGALQVLVIGLALAYNNLNTPELVSMCEINDKVNLLINEEIIHLLGFGFFLAILIVFSKEKQPIKISV